MTFARHKVTGRGTLKWRVSVEGLQYEFVDHSSMATTVGGRTRIDSLNTRDLKLGERVDLARAKLDATGFRVYLAAVPVVTAALSARPTLVTYLDANATDVDTSITVKSTAGWPSSGHIHLNQEAIAYGSKDATHFLGCTRAQWDTVARYHYTTDGARLRFPEVTDSPQVLEGRRCRVYAYGPGDSAIGSGTQIWLGVVRTEPQFNGVNWSFTVDSIASILDADMGAELQDGGGLRGIYYPSTAPLTVQISQLNDQYPTSTATATVSFIMAGFWEDQLSFCTSLTNELSTQMTAAGGFTQSVYAIEDGGSWAFGFDTPSSSPKWMACVAESAVDRIGQVNVRNSSPVVVRAAGLAGAVSLVAASTSYKVVQQYNGSWGTTPRAIMGIFPTAALIPSDANRVNINGDTYPAYRMYLGLDTLSSSISSVNGDWTSSGWDPAGRMASGEFTQDVVRLDASTKWVDIYQPASLILAVSGKEYYAYVGGEKPKIRLGLTLNDSASGSGSLRDILISLASGSTRWTNAGAMPDIRLDDFESDSRTRITPSGDTRITAGAGDTRVTAGFHAEDLSSVITGSPLAIGYPTLFSETNLSEYVAELCKTMGIYVAINAAGQLTFRRLKLPTASEAASTTISKTQILVDDNLLSYEKNPYGMINTVLFRTGYDPIADEFAGPVVKIRDVAAYGVCPKPSVLEIAPKAPGLPNPAENPEPYERAASAILGVFGGPHTFLTISVPMTLFDTIVGDVVSITWAKVPDIDGALGVAGKIGLVVARQWEPTKARGELTVLLTDQRIGGYSPGFQIAVISGTSGTTGPFGLTPTYGYMPVGTDPTDFWAMGDLIRVFKWNSAVASAVLGSVTSVSATTLTITTTSNWTHTGATWSVGSQVSTSITAATQKVFVYQAGTDALLDFSGDADRAPFTFAP